MWNFVVVFMPFAMADAMVSSAPPDLCGRDAMGFFFTSQSAEDAGHVTCYVGDVILKTSMKSTS